MKKDGARDPNAREARAKERGRSEELEGEAQPGERAENRREAAEERAEWRMDRSELELSEIIPRDMAEQHLPVDPTRPSVAELRNPRKEITRHRKQGDEAERGSVDEARLVASLAPPRIVRIRIRRREESEDSEMKDEKIFRMEDHPET